MSLIETAFCVAGIYGAFLTWAVLQERISTTPYGSDGLIFRGSMVINTVQAIQAAIIGYFYVKFRERNLKPSEKYPIFASRKLVTQFAIIALSQSLASPASYASLKYVDYLTLLLAKSCKLLPVMFLHVTLYRRRFPLYKYVVVIVISAGVILFSLGHTSSRAAKVDELQSSTQSIIGIGLLLVSLLLDGFTNSTQDQLFKTNNRVTGPHLMCAINCMSILINSLVLLSPFTTQLQDSILFIKAHPQILTDIVLFGFCGAAGQVFIFHTIERFGSIMLVTVTVTRKMFSMLLSVIWFNHRLNLTQWAGVLLVFAGIVGETYAKIGFNSGAASSKKTKELSESSKEKNE